MKKKNNTYPYILGVALAAFLLHSCNTRYLQENELLYTERMLKLKMIL